MKRIRKATIGIRLSEKLFRLSSLGGLIADEVIAASNSMQLDATYFSQVIRPNAGNSLHLTNEKLGHSLVVDFENIVLNHDFYEQEKEFDSAKLLADFGQIWDAINSVLHVKQVRRVGFVAEYRFPKKTDTSAHLLSTLTKLKPHGMVDKFQLQYESRKATGPHGLPDPSKDDFYNYIQQIYDGAVDSEHSESGYFNANFDVQRYYAPALTKDIPGAAKSLIGEFDKAVQPFFEELIALGLCDA